jgi:hypothetical protein
MQQDLCSAIHQSVTTFVETAGGRALAQRGRRGELQPGEFFAAACASAQSAVLDHLAGSMDALPDNLEQAYLQAWALADGSARRFDLDWRLDDERLADGVEVRYRLELVNDCVRLIVDALAEAPASA